LLIVKDIDTVFSYSKIFVLPSRSEGFPNALIEAMAHGLACVSFDINAGPRDVIENGVNGVLIEDGDIDSLATNINELIINESLRIQLGEKAKKLKDKLSLDGIGKEFLNFIVPKL
jgi:GalNAc-alpha-(1->4)-GalNAc-alpha-(1->3)-diNAcBac-PP-undecaprenol alpha-1,4-N-acetyl-D-galactosaminyltransferase